MIENTGKYRIILATQSPRRHELLKGTLLPFETIQVREVEEDFPAGLPVNETALFLATKKANAYSDLWNENNIIITADTVVICNNKVLGKPNNEYEAIKMLQELSGNKHKVITGVHIQKGNITRKFEVSTDVYFRVLTNKEIEFYVSNFKPMDKAGAYGIQEWIGYIGVERIEGSFFNVMGLPVQKLYEELSQLINVN